jgi:DNA repair ATPase RecN
MTGQEQIILIETEQRSKSNTHRLDAMEADMREIKNDQKAIYKIATSVEVIAQRVSNIEDKVDDTNDKVNAQTKAWQETERRLTEAQNEPNKRIANNVNSLKLAIITAVCTFLATGIVDALVLLLK